MQAQLVEAVWAIAYNLQPDEPVGGRRRACSGVFTALQEEEIIRIRVEALSLSGTTVQVHPNGTDAEEKTARNLSDAPEVGGAPKFIWLLRMIGEQ